MPLAPAAFIAGAATWSLLEYGLHRFVGHAPKQRKSQQKPTLLDGDFGSEHQAHHRDTRYFTPTPRKVRAAVVAVAAMSAVGSLIVGPRRALSFALGLGLTYGFYEVVHRRTHTHAPRHAYARWARKHHLHHHFGDPRTNHGVTSSLWDHVFGTHVTPGKIRVPRRHAPDWLLDAQGRVKPEYAEDYELARERPSAPAAAQAA